MKQVNGTFLFEAERSSGSVEGTFCVVRNSQTEVEIELRPIRGWHPCERKCSVLLTYWVVPLFKRWPITNLWSANVEVDEYTVAEI